MDVESVTVKLGTPLETDWESRVWLLAPENSLTARVAVNRHWAQLFGRGLVETQEDFGTRGSHTAIPSCSTGWPASSATAAGR